MAIKTEINFKHLLGILGIVNLHEVFGLTFPDAKLLKKIKFKPSRKWISSSSELLGGDYNHLFQSVINLGSSELSWQFYTHIHDSIIELNSTDYRNFQRQDFIGHFENVGLQNYLRGLGKGKLTQDELDVLESMPSTHNDQFLITLVKYKYKLPFKGLLNVFNKPLINYNN